jgi:DNA-directed RNA polymerase specialized sigma24 family protein
MVVNEQKRIRAGVSGRFRTHRRFLISRGAQTDVAQEAAQAAWARGWERLEQLQNEQLVIMWVNTIALNAYRWILRSDSRHHPLPELTSTLTFDLAAIDIDRVLRFCRPRSACYSSSDCWVQPLKRSHAIKG